MTENDRSGSGSIPDARYNDLVERVEELEAGGGGGDVPFVGTDPPPDPTDGMLWWDPDDDTPSGGSQAVKATITVADVLAADGAVAAFVVIDGGGMGNMTFTAADEGIAGNAIAILSDVQPDVGTLTVDVDGTTITLHLKTNSNGDVLSTFAEVVAAVTGTPAAAALVTASGSGAALYDQGDAYLQGGESVVFVATLAAGAVIWDAQEFFPAAWNANTVLTPRVGAGFAVIYYDGPPATDTVDDTGAAGVAVAQTDEFFNTARRLRLTEEGDLVVRAGCDAGTVPTEGEMLLVVEVL